MSDDFWRQIDRRIDQRIERILADALRNAKGGGDLTLGVGAIGAVLTASSTQWQVTHTRSYACRFDAIHIEGEPAGTATLDVKIRRPEDAINAETTIFGGSKPELVNTDGGGAIRARDYFLSEFDDGWNRYIPPGSVLFLYITAISGCEKIALSFRQKNL